jgi:hypothetical protein
MAALLAPPAGSTLPGTAMSGAGNAALPANTAGSAAELNRLPSVTEMLSQPLVRRPPLGLVCFAADVGIRLPAACVQDRARHAGANRPARPAWLRRGRRGV